MVIFIPRNILEKQQIHLAGRNFGAAGSTNNIQLSMLILDFMVKCRLKNTQWNFCGIHEMCDPICKNPEQSRILENSDFCTMVFCIPKAFFCSSIKSVIQIRLELQV